MKSSYTSQVLQSFLFLTCMFALLAWIFVLASLVSGCGSPVQPITGPRGANGTSVQGVAGVDGQNGADGAPGASGADGKDGTSCTVAQIPEGAVITCPDGTSAVIEHGKDAPAHGKVK